MKNLVKTFGKKIGLATGAAAMLASSGCCNLMNPSCYNLPVDSDPQGARIELRDYKDDTVWVGKTPCTVPITRRVRPTDPLIPAVGRYVLVPFHPVTGQPQPQMYKYIDYKVSPILFLNVFNGFIGWIADISNGSEKTYDETPIHLKFSDSSQKIVLRDNSPKIPSYLLRK